MIGLLERLLELSTQFSLFIILVDAIILMIYIWPQASILLLQNVLMYIVSQLSVLKFLSCVKHNSTCSLLRDYSKAFKPVVSPFGQHRAVNDHQFFKYSCIGIAYFFYHFSEQGNRQGGHLFVQVYQVVIGFQVSRNEVPKCLVDAIVQGLVVTVMAIELVVKNSHIQDDERSSISCSPVRIGEAIPEDHESSRRETLYLGIIEPVVVLLQLIQALLHFEVCRIIKSQNYLVFLNRYASLLLQFIVNIDNPVLFFLRIVYIVKNLPFLYTVELHEYLRLCVHMFSDSLRRQSRVVLFDGS